MLLLVLAVDDGLGVGPRSDGQHSAKSGHSRGIQKVIWSFIHGSVVWIYDQRDRPQKFSRALLQS